MRRVVGPILTTGVALAASAVVVANPIVSTRADVQIPSVTLSAGSSDDVASMLDQEFLDAIAPAPPKSTNPFSVLKDLITSLAADATDLGKSAIVGAFVAGVTAVSEPELTASATPYFPPSAILAGESPAVIASVLPGLDLPAVSEAISALPPPPDPAGLSAALSSLPDPRDFLPDGVAPAVTSLVTTLVDDARFVSRELVVAAFAAGAAVAAQPGLIAETVVALAKGDFKGALSTAITVVTAPLGPTVIVVDALRAVVENRLADLSGAVSRTSTPGPNATVDAGAAEVLSPVRVERTVAPVVSAPADPTDGPTDGPTDVSTATSGPGARDSDAKDPDIRASAREVATEVSDTVAAAREQVSATVSGSDAGSSASAEAGAASRAGNDGERSRRGGRGGSADN